MYKFLIACCCLVATTGCWKPYDTPEFAEIQHHETGYLIPLEGANEKSQGKFESEDFLETNKVAIKRVQIPHRWIKTGRMPGKGRYIDTVRLVVVDRTPVTREWTASSNSGIGKTDQAIWLESRDSIGFSLGFNCTAFINEPDTSTFLYWYPTARPGQADLGFDKSVAGLAHVMDSEIRARVQMLANTIAARYDLDDLRARKAEILEAVRNGIPEQKDADGNVIHERLVGAIEHFSTRGITITNLGQFGGFEYDDPSIQTAINETFVAQQEKVRTEAAFEAQQKKNERIELEANALAEKARRIAQGEADAISLIAEATKKANQDPLFLELKKLEVEQSRINQWNGVYPQTFMGFGGSGSPDLLLNVSP